MINYYNVDKAYRTLADRIYYKTLEYFCQTEDIFEIELEGVDKEDIRLINKEERGVDKATDVLSFQNIADLVLPCSIEDYPDDIDYESGKLMLGDILICIDVMKEQAAEYGHSEERETAYLTLHGILHLLGYDHMTKADKEEMRKCEDAILDSLEINR